MAQIGERVEADQICPEQALQNLVSPRQRSKDIGGWKRDVQEETDPGVWHECPQHLGHENQSGHLINAQMILSRASCCRLLVVASSVNPKSGQGVANMDAGIQGAGQPRAAPAGLRPSDSDAVVGRVETCKTYRLRFNLDD